MPLATTLRRIATRIERGEHLTAQDALKIRTAAAWIEQTTLPSRFQPGQMTEAIDGFAKEVAGLIETLDQHRDEGTTDGPQV